MEMIQTFHHQMFGEIRTMTNEKGEVFFVGKDVAQALGYNNPLKAIRDHVDEDDKGVNVSFTPGGKQKTTIINESGLYALILSSKLPQAKAFKHWVKYCVGVKVYNYVDLFYKLIASGIGFVCRTWDAS